MTIDLSRLGYEFETPPLLIGGMAMEYYGLRPAGADVDFVVTSADYEGLARRYPDHLRDLWGDLGVCVYEFEIWRSICLHRYDELAAGALDADGYRIISLERLLLLKALGYKVPKYRHDLELIVDRLTKIKYDPWWEQLSPEQQAHYQSTTN